MNYATALNWLAKKQPRGGYAVDSQDARNLAELILAASNQLDQLAGRLGRASARERGLGRRQIAAAPEVRESQRAARFKVDIEEALKAACASLLRKIGDLAETRPDDFKAQELANVQGC